MTVRNEELGEALEQIDMEYWLDREGIKYRVTHGSRGTQLNIKDCPCCGSSSWKVYLNADNGLGNCFSGDCEARFNKWKFIKASLGRVTDREVVEHIKAVAKEMGWQPPKVESAPVNYHTELKLPDSIELPHNGRNLKYLANRNITGEIAAYFKLRYSAHGKFEYFAEGGIRRVQDYSSRIIIPIFDLFGDLVSFQGRDTTGTADKKYLFPPGFSATGAHLYNGHNAIGAKRVCVGEGVFDVAATKIALDGEMQLRDVIPIGSFGKHLSYGSDESQLSKFRELREHGLEQVTFMWDSEPAALEAAVDAALMLREIGLLTRIAVLPEGCDPNETTADEVRRAFWKAEVVTAASAVKFKLKAQAMR